MFPCVPLVEGSGVLPRKILKTKNAEAISGYFAKRKVSNLPELCLFATVSEEKVPIYFFS